MNDEPEFESVKSNGPIWEPKQTGNKKDKNLTALKPDDNSYIMGYYLGATPNQGPKQDSMMHKIKMSKVGDKNHIIGDLEENKEVSIWGTNVLDDNLSKINPGDFCKIVWEGKKEPKKGGNEYHSWDVLKAKGVEPLKMGGTPDVGATTEAPAQSIPEISPVATETTEDEDEDMPF